MSTSWLIYLEGGKTQIIVVRNHSALDSTLKDSSRHITNESLSQQLAKYIEDSGAFLGYLINLVLKNDLLINNLFVTSKNEFSNSPIHEFKVLQNVFKIKKQGLKCFLK